MPDPQDLSHLISRIRGGDEQAAKDLLDRYGQVLRRTISLRLENSSVRGVVDTEDIQQSVFKSLFVRLRLGQYEIGSEGKLVNLILRMGHNKLTALQRRQRKWPVKKMGSEFVAPGPSPSRVLSAKELCEEALRRLTEEERRILQLRDDGKSWEEIAAELGGTADARRKQWARARARVADELGLDRGE